MQRREWHEVANWFDKNQGDIFPGILKAIGDAAGMDVLDVGCGGGSLARILARRGSRVRGLDGSTPIIERARAREAANPLGITYQACDTTRLTMIADNTFDLVVSCMTSMDMPMLPARSGKWRGW